MKPYENIQDKQSDEYKQFLIWQSANGNPKLCEYENCDYQKTCTKKKWSWSHFWIGRADNKFIAWFVYMILQFIVLLFSKLPDNIKGLIIIVSAIVTIIFMFGVAIDKAIERTEIKVNANLEAKVSSMLSRINELKENKNN